MSSNKVPQVPRRLLLSGLLLVAGLFAVVPGSLCAHEGAEGVVKERMLAMESVGEAMKNITAMIRGQTDYDPTTIATKARLISGHGGTALTRLFPEGSLDAPTAALPEIWADWTRFQALARDLSIQGELLARAVEQEAGTATERQLALDPNASDEGRADPSGRVKPPKVAYAELVRVCANCHKAFRAKK